MLVRLVFAWTWHVQVLWTRVRLHTEAELCNLAWLSVFAALGLVFEIEVTNDLVLVRSRRVFVAAELGALGLTDLDSFAWMQLRVKRLVCVRTDSVSGRASFSVPAFAGGADDESWDAGFVRVS